MGGPMWEKHLRQQRILRILRDAGDWVTAYDVARALGRKIDLGLNAERNVKALLDGLISQGLVESRRPNVMLSYEYRLTETGTYAAAVVPKEG